MATVLVVSRNPAMAMGLSATECDVIELRPQAFGDWIEGTGDADALILDLDSPQLAMAAVGKLREHAKHAPVLLVSSDRPGWDAPELTALAAAEVLPLPVTRPALVTALEHMLTDRRTTTTAPPSPDAVPEPGHPDVAAPSAAAHLTAATEGPADFDSFSGLDLSGGFDLPPLEHGAVSQALQDLRSEPDHFLVEETDPLDEVIAVISDPDGPRDELPAFAGAPVLTPEAHATERPAEDTVDIREADAPAAPPLSAVPRTRKSSRLPLHTATNSVREMEALRPKAAASSRSSMAVDPPEVEKRRTASSRRREPAVAGTPEHARPEVTDEDAISLVRRLSLLSHALYGVPETADVVVVDAVERVAADAGALLVPDDGSWRVSAGVGLRPLEFRYELHQESWLVQQVAQAQRGAIIEDSDIAREQLQGAPLASWRHLLAAPIPAVQAVLILARREDPPFDEQDLATLATLGAEAGPLLSAAVDTRNLARLLHDFRDEDDLPR